MAEKQADNNYLALLCVDLEHTAQAFAAGAISKVVFEMRHARHLADVREMAGIGSAKPAFRAAQITLTGKTDDTNNFAAILDSEAAHVAEGCAKMKTQQGGT